MIKFKPDITKLEKTLTKRLETGIKNALELLKNNIDSITPEDTRTLLSNNEISEVVAYNGKVSWKVFNTTPYAIYVEYWVSGKPYTYHKPKWVPFYNGIWNRTFARWIDMTKKEALEIIKNALW